MDDKTLKELAHKVERLYIHIMSIKEENSRQTRAIEKTNDLLKQLIEVSKKK